MMESLTYETGLREECGVFGMFDLEGGDVARDMYYGLSALQHRGQESCGIAVCDTNGPKGVVNCYKGLGKGSHRVLFYPSHFFTFCQNFCFCLKCLIYFYTLDDGRLFCAFNAFNSSNTTSFRTLM